MDLTGKTPEELQRLEYNLRLEVGNLQRQIYAMGDPAQFELWSGELVVKQNLLYEIEQARRAPPPATRSMAAPDPAAVPRTTRSAMTTGLEAVIEPRMAHIPTALYHLFDKASNPLFYCKVTNASTQKRRVRITSYIDGYSAEAVDTYEIERGQASEVYQLPTLFPDKIRLVRELTRATLNVKIDDLDSGKIEIHRTEPIWLLARNSAPLSVQDPVTKEWNDLSRYLGAFVTPNALAVMEFQRKVAKRHPEGQLAGYQGLVEPQAEAIFAALKQDADVTYVNSVIDFNPDQTARTQRVRLPRESLEEHQANCIDGALLFASLLEGISINPALVVVPGHAFVGWQTHPEKDEWRYLETTLINSHTFQQALDSGSRKATFYKKQWESTKLPQWFRHWSVRELRAHYTITPLE